MTGTLRDDAVGPLTNTGTTFTGLVTDWINGVDIAVPRLDDAGVMREGRAYLKISKQVVPGSNDINDGPYYPGDLVSFLVTINNTNGTRLATGNITDTLPANLAFVSASVSQPTN